MESWDGWDDFLKIIASDYDLTVDQEAVFLVRLSRQSIDRKRTNQDIANEVIGGESDKALYAYNKRMKEVFDKLSQNFPEINSDSRGKVERTQTCLEKTYLEQQNKKNSKVLFNAIAPPDWYKICHERLESQKQNIRRQATEIVSEPFYVQLGLVERRHQPRRSNDVCISPEQGSGFFQLDKEEIIETYEHDEFLEQVIKHKQSKKSQGKRIAIIGEPGAGKTTLLEAIAFSPKTPGFPIWISLGSLGDNSLEEYLCQKWLKDALKTSDVTQQLKALEELFKSGEVLLLLDGVDEMPASSPVEALAKIRHELTGWVADARVVLTCRVNVWDASVNALQGFDTYRTLEFSYGNGDKPDQVKEFICQWFSNTDKPELGEPLRKKLDEDRHQRIRDLVKNPMRLSLLCQSWYFKQGDLPETKAALYEQFTRAFYDWKEEQFSTTPTKRKELNAALGLLAREAIDKEKSRFGIRESFAIDVMGKDLFDLACKLHWLNFVYRNVDTGEKVCAFFHPTFQEYFAALAIPDWGYFLNHVPHNPSQGTYRIFESQWKEVFLLWLGREEDEIFKLKKELLICNLGVFEDGCGNFYKYRAILLAATGLAEFKDCGCADVIVSLLFPLAFGCDEWSTPILDDPIAEAARKTLSETHRAEVINKLIDLIENRDDIVLKALETLGEVAIGNKQAINLLVRLIETSQDKDIREFAASSLEKIGAGNQRAIDELLRLLKTLDNKNVQELIAYSLGRIAIGNHQAIDELLKIISTYKNEHIRWKAAYVLAQINPGNEKALEGLVRILENTKDENIFRKIAWNLGRLNTVNQMVIDVLIQLILTTKSKPIYWEIPWSLGQILTGNQHAIDVLMRVLSNTKYKNISHHAHYKIGENKAGKEEVIKALLGLLQEVNSEPLRQNIPIHNLQIVVTELEKSIAREKEMEALVNSIIKIDESSIDQYNKIFRTYHLHWIVTQFKKILFKDNEDKIVIANKIIWSCTHKMKYPDFYYTWHGQLPPIQALEHQLIYITNQLQPTDKTYPIAIDTQTLKIETNTSAISQKLCTKIYRQAGYFEIPTANDAAQLQQYIPRIQEQLQKPNLALILHGSEPNEHLLNFCYSFGDRDLGIYISLITSQPVEQPLKGFLPNQENLLSAIQSWINEIG